VIGAWPGSACPCPDDRKSGFEPRLSEECDGDDQRCDLGVICAGTAVGNGRHDRLSDGASRLVRILRARSFLSYLGRRKISAIKATSMSPSAASRGENL
jgi:hypothetical protein